MPPPARRSPLGSASHAFWTFLMEAGEEEKNFYFFRHNPLKSPDSTN